MLGHLACARTLIAAGADVNARTDTGITVLGVLLLSRQTDGDLALLQLLINAGAAVRGFDISGTPPLHYLAERDCSQRMQVLLDAGADVDERDSDGCTPLHRAETRRACEVLVGAGADVNAASIDGQTPLHTALTDNPALPRLAVVTYLLRHGARLEAQTKSGYTALHTACRFNQLEPARALLEAGASLATMDTNQRTPMDLARAYNAREVVELVESWVRRLRVDPRLRASPERSDAAF